MNTEFIFIQQVQVNGYLVVGEHILSCSYIEPGDISGVKLILALHDPDALYHDNVGIKKDSELKITFGDVDGRGDVNWTSEFIVEIPKVKDGVLTLECFEKNSKSLKKPATKPIFFTNMQPKAILAKLCPNLTVESSNFPQAGTYHLNCGATPARLIRNMARDYGAMCFIARGTVYFLSIKELSKTPEMQLERDNPSSEVSIAKYDKIGEEALYERILDRNYTQWDTVEGIQASNKNASKENVFISTPGYFALDNQNVGMIPILNVMFLGNGRCMPGMCVKVIFHKRTAESQLDESVPTIQHFSQVVHYQEGQRYLCKAELSVIHE